MLLNADGKLPNTFMKIGRLEILSKALKEPDQPLYKRLRTNAEATGEGLWNTLIGITGKEPILWERLVPNTAFPSWEQ